MYEALRCSNDILKMILIDGKKIAAELRDELKKEVNEWADPDNSGKDFFTLWMAQAKESEEE